MKRTFTAALSCVAVCFLFVPTALAETSDGMTPVKEGICDPLQADDITKGLYGLCVAFCEAQDLAAGTEPLTGAEFETLLSEPPSGRILDAYNKRKQESDPPMPCVLVGEPCPCFTHEELMEIDGINVNGYPDHLGCMDTAEQVWLVEMSYSLFAFAQPGHCEYGDDLTGIHRRRTIWSEPPVTSEEIATCTAMLRARIADGLCWVVNTDP